MRASTPFVSIETLCDRLFNVKYVNSDENSRFSRWIGNREQPQRTKDHDVAPTAAAAGEESAEPREAQTKYQTPLYYYYYYSHLDELICFSVHLLSSLLWLGAWFARATSNGFAFHYTAFFFFFFCFILSPPIRCVHSLSFHWIFTFNTSYMTVSVMFVKSVKFISPFFPAVLAPRCHVWCSHFRFCLLFSRAKDEIAHTTPQSTCVWRCHVDAIKSIKTSSECSERRHSINCEYMLAYEFFVFLKFRCYAFR